MVPGPVGQHSLGPAVSLENLLDGVTNVPTEDYNEILWHTALYFSPEIPSSPSDHVELVSLIFFRLAVVESVAPARDERKTMDLRDEDQVFLVRGEILL